MQEVYLRNIIESPVRERDEAELSRVQLSCDVGPKTVFANCPGSPGARKTLMRCPNGTKMPGPSCSRPSHLYWPLDTGFPERRGGPYSQGHSLGTDNSPRSRGPESCTSVPHTEYSQLPPSPGLCPCHRFLRFSTLNHQGLNLDVILLLLSPSVLLEPPLP